MYREKFPGRCAHMIATMKTDLTTKCFGGERKLENIEPPVYAALKQIYYETLFGSSLRCRKR